jgi:hypothetical protein
MGYAVKLQKKDGSEEPHYVVGNIINGTYSPSKPTGVTTLAKNSAGDSSKFVYSITWYYNTGTGGHTTVFRTLPIVGNYLHLNYCYVAASNSSVGNRIDINIIIDGVSENILHAQSRDQSSKSITDCSFNIQGKQVYIEYSAYSQGNNTVTAEIDTLSYY